MTTGSDSIAPTIAAPEPGDPPALSSSSASSPPPAIAYRTGQRGWPWDVRVIATMGVLWAALQILQAGVGIIDLVRQRSLTWFGPGYSGWTYVLGVLLRSILPCLLIVGLIGLLRFKSGARRMCVLVAATFAVFGVIEAVVQALSTLAGKPYAYDVPAHMVGVAQSFLMQYALMLVLLVTLMRADVKLLASEN
jgi:hypothetical protein